MMSGKQRRTPGSGALIPIEDAQAALAFPSAAPHSDEPRVAELATDVPVSAPVGGLRAWNFGPVDLAISGVLLALVAGVCIPTALHYRQEANRMDQQRAELTSRCRQLGTTLRFVESRRAALSQFRRSVDRYVADVESRPIVPWVTTIGEMSRRRPYGVSARRMSGDGPRIRIDVAAASPDLVQAYAQSLRESPYLDFAALPAGAAPSAAGGQIIGRLAGE